MRKRNQDKNENQFKLEFQSNNRSFSKEEKELNSLAQAVGADKAGVSEKVQSASVFKTKAVQADQPKDLSKKSAESKIKEIACSDNKSTGLFFDNLITVEELAVVFGLAPQTIRNWVAQGKLPYVKIGKRNMFLIGSLQKWLNQKEVPQWQ